MRLHGASFCPFVLILDTSKKILKHVNILKVSPYGAIFFLYITAEARYSVIKKKSFPVHVFLFFFLYKFLAVFLLSLHQRCSLFLQKTFTFYNLVVKKKGKNKQFNCKNMQNNHFPKKMNSCDFKIPLIASVLTT